MHLLTFLTLKEKNNLIFRTMVIGGQVGMLVARFCSQCHVQTLQRCKAYRGPHHN